jgi:hypothetical protein
MDELEIKNPKVEVLNWTNRPLADSQSNLRPPLLDFELSDCPFLNSFSLLSGKYVVALTQEGVALPPNFLRALLLSNTGIE